MQKKFLTKFIQLISIVLNVQLLFGPVALADQKQKGWGSAADIANFSTQLIGQASQAYLQGANGGAGQRVGQAAMIEARLSPMLRIRPVDARQIVPVFAGCFVLPASGATVTGGMSCREASDQQVQSGYTDAMLNILEFNMIELKKFQTKGHERFTTQGIGCYEKKLEDFEGTLLAREERLSKLKNQIKQSVENFNLKWKETKEKIKEKTALLTGKPSKYLKNKDFTKEFFGSIEDPNNVCASVISQSKIKRASKNGFNAIKEELFSNMNQKNSYTPEEILSSTGAKIEKDIRSIAAKISNSVGRKSNINRFKLESVSINSPYFDNSNKSLQKVVKQFQNDTNEELETLEDELKLSQVVSKDGSSEILADIKNGNANIDERIRVYERDTKKSCLKSTIRNNFGSINGFAKKFRNPNVSKKLSRSADNAFASEIVSWINDPETGIDQALSRIKSVESQGQNAKKIIVTGKSFSVQGKTISASTPLRASQLIGILTDNCNREFAYRRNKNGYAPKDVVKKLRAYAGRVKSLRATAASRIKSNVIDQLINCPSDTATGSGAMSCKDALSKGSANFCLKSARTCSNNHQGCMSKAESKITEHTDARKVMADSYNTDFKLFRGSLKRDLTVINKFMEDQARSLDGQMSMGTLFRVPPLEFNLDKIFALSEKGIAEELDMEDPEAILKMANKEIDGLQKKLADQRKDQIKKVNKIKKEYVANYKTQERHWKKMIDECNGRNQAYDEAKRKADEQIAKDNQKIDQACQELYAFNQGPECDSIGDLMETVQEASALAAGAMGGPEGAHYNKVSTQQALGQLQKIKQQCSVNKDAYVPKRVPEDFDRMLYCDRNVTTSTDEGYSECNAFKLIQKDYPNGLCLSETIKEKLANFEFCKAGTNYTLPEDGKCKNGDTETDPLKLGSTDSFDEAYRKLASGEGTQREFEKNIGNNSLKCYTDYTLVAGSGQTETIANKAQKIETFFIGIAGTSSSPTMGEQDISVAMCGGGYNGMQDSGGWGQVGGAAGEILGQFNSIRRE